jgi:prepilin signal peptidase PulO-like enzyme (type II secretory pathway)
MSTLGKVATIVVLLFGVWFAIVGIVMDEARFDYVRIGAVALIGFGIAIALIDRKFNRN